MLYRFSLVSGIMAEPSSETAILFFYRDKGPDHCGRFLAEILEWNHDALENTHDYIQWLFPLQERSGFNPRAPVLTPVDFMRFHSEFRLRRRLLDSLSVMLSFYGLEKTEKRVVCASSWPVRSPHWLTPSNHNHLRITRMLKALSMLGCERQARQFLEALESIASANKGRVTAETLEFWRRAAGRPAFSS